HVDARRVAPLGDDIPVAEEKAVRPAARPHRPKRLVPWRLLLEITGDHLGEIPAPRCFIFARVSRRGGDGGLRQAGFTGRCAFPGSGMWRREIGHGAPLSLTGVDFPDISTTS